MYTNVKLKVEDCSKTQQPVAIAGSSRSGHFPCELCARCCGRGSVALQIACLLPGERVLVLVIDELR